MCILSEVTENLMNRIERHLMVWAALVTSLSGCSVPYDCTSFGVTCADNAVCDPDSHRCVCREDAEDCRCTRHDQCASGVCDVYAPGASPSAGRTGSCIAASRIVYVNNQPSESCASPDGSRQCALSSLEGGIVTAISKADSASPIYVRIHGSTAPYAAPDWGKLSIASGKDCVATRKKVVLMGPLGDPSEPPVSVRGDWKLNPDKLPVGLALVLDGITLENAGIKCSGQESKSGEQCLQLSIRRSQLQQVGATIESTGCFLSIDSALFDGGYRPVITQVDAGFEITNTIFHNNAAPVTGGAFELMKLSVQANKRVFQFNTINNSMLSEAGGIQCAQDGPKLADSLIVPALVAGNCTATVNGKEIKAAVADSTDISWSTNGTYQLGAGSPLIDQVTDSASLYRWDFYGNPRPSGAGSDIGAVEYVPPQ